MISPVRKWQARFYGCAGVSWLEEEVAFDIDGFLLATVERLKQEIKSL